MPRTTIAPKRYSPASGPLPEIKKIAKQAVPSAPSGARRLEQRKASGVGGISVEDQMKGVVYYDRPLNEAIAGGSDSVDQLTRDLQAMEFTKCTSSSSTSVEDDVSERIVRLRDILGRRIGTDSHCAQRMKERQSKKAALSQNKEGA